MMRQVADNLKGQEYINGDKVEAIRKYIRVKNPGCSEEELSAVFADALHKIIDARICQFEEKHRKKIKAAVLKKAVKKSEFSINALEVFASCLEMKLREDIYLQSFTQWINQSQPIPVSAHQVDKLLTGVELLDTDYIENNLDDIVNRFEDLQREAEIIETQDLGAFEAIEPHLYEELSDEKDETCIELIDAEEAKFIEVQAPEAESAHTHRFALNSLFAVIHKLADQVFRNIKYVKPSMKLSLAGMLPLVIITAFTVSALSGGNRVQALSRPEQGRYANIAMDQVDRYLSLESRMLSKLDVLAREKGLILLDGLHDELRYASIDEGSLKKWLNRKNSMLADEPYFTAILETAKNYDIHPVFMFAIVGQEQAFVPKSGAAAKKIANNPFNVYGSWEKYNTNIYDSSRLAASTIIESSRNRPAYVNTIKWINRRYAEDPNWWNGVSMLFAQIKKEISDIK